MSTAPASAHRRRAAVLLGGPVLSVLLLAGPALAATGPDPESKYGDPLSPLETFLLFVVLPVVSLVVLAALTALPSARRRPRYRPARGWDRGAVWFGGPAGSRSVVEDAVRDADVRPESLGGARGNW